MILIHKENDTKISTNFENQILGSIDLLAIDVVNTNSWLHCVPKKITVKRKIFKWIVMIVKYPTKKSIWTWTVTSHL